jgi:type IV pilus assembly protein PilO
MKNNQFSNLDIKEAHSWAILPKTILLLAIFTIPVVAGWYFHLEDKNMSLNAEKNTEENLKKSFQDKYSQVQSLESLKEKKRLVDAQVKALEGFLPDKTEMDKLLSDINQAGVARNLNFELFEPKDALIKEYYAQIPVNIKIKGLYHDVATFMSDVAGLSRIVNVQTMKISNIKNSEKVEVEGLLNTYRLLDKVEKEANANAKKAKVHPTNAPANQT